MGAYTRTPPLAVSENQGERKPHQRPDTPILLHEESTMQSQQEKSATQHETPMLISDELRAHSRFVAQKSLQAIEAVVAKLIAVQDSAKELNECTAEANAAFFAIWNDMGYEYFGDTTLRGINAVKSFSVVHCDEIVPGSDAIILGTPPGHAFDKYVSSRNGYPFVSISSEYRVYIVPPTIQGEKNAQATVLRTLNCDVEYMKVVNAVHDGICQGLGARSLPVLPSIISNLKVTLGHNSSTKNKKGFSASTICCLKLLRSVFWRRNSSSTVNVIVGKREVLLDGNAAYNEELKLSCRISEACEQMGQLDHLAPEKSRALLLAFLFNLNSTWDTGQGTREFGYVNIAHIEEPPERQLSDQFLSDRVHGWWLRLRRLLTRETFYQECKKIKYHLEGAVVKLPKLPQFTALGYIVSVVALSLYVGIGDVGSRGNILEQILDAVQVATVLLVGIFGIIKLTSEDNNVLRHLLLGVKVMKDSGAVQRYLGLKSEGEVKALLALVDPGCSWLENVNTGMLDEERHSGKIRMEDGCTLEELMRFNGRIIGDTIEWFSEGGNRAVTVRKRLEKGDRNVRSNRLVKYDYERFSYKSSHSFFSPSKTFV